jgi:hypothetical protein
MIGAQVSGRSGDAVSLEKGNGSGKCRVCGRVLKNPKYMAAGIGPVCARKSGVRAPSPQAVPASPLAGDLFYYPATIGGSVMAGVCRVRRRVEESGAYTVIFQEVPENRGRSVTNAFEVIATEYARREGLLDPASVRWIDRSQWSATPDSEVSLDWNNGIASSPRWRAVGRVA